MSNPPQIAQSPASASSGTPPGLAPKPMMSAPPVTKIVTSKEWVLPPRPKPGRKPSADTPATKRKAQNRAAQRAFRERRATRVAELEQKLSEVEKERELSELNWKNMVNKMQMENKFLLKALNDIKADYSQFKQSMQQQQHLPQPNTIGGPGSHASPPPAVFSNGTVQAPSPLNYYKPPQPQQQQQQQHIHHHQQQQQQQQQPQQLINQDYRFPQRFPQQQPQQTTQPQTHQHLSVSPALSSPHDQLAPSTAKTSVSSVDGGDDDYDCGVCEKDDCICAQVGIKPRPTPKTHTHPHQDPTPVPQPQQIMNMQPMAPVSLKRKAVDEVDFTAQFAKSTTKTVSKPMPKFKKLKQDTTTIQIDDPAKEFSTVFDGISVKDFEQCGFCSDDSPCVCREAAKEAANAITELQNHSKRESLAQQVQQQQAQQVQQVQQQKQESVLPPISRHSSVSGNKLPVLHPGPTVEISEHHRSSIGTPTDTTAHSREASTSSSSKQAGCTGNPGTCTQCQLDPMSTLFCTTIASKSEEEEHQKMALSANTSAVGSPRSGSIVEMSVNAPPQPQQAPSPRPQLQASIKLEDKRSPVSPPISTHSSKVSSPLTSTSPDEELNSLIKRAGTTLDTQTPGGGHAKGIYITCADAYKTLSRHKGFHSVDFSTLVGKLTTRGMQVEVQSVANVLRELDRRLYN